MIQELIVWTNSTLSAKQVELLHEYTKRSYEVPYFWPKLIVVSIIVAQLVIFAWVWSRRNEHVLMPESNL